MNPDMQPIRPPHIPNISNSQLSPSGSSVRKRENTGDTFTDVSLLCRYHLLQRQDTPGTVTYHVMHRYASVCIVFIVSSPSSLRQTTRLTRLLVPRSTTVLTTPPSCQGNQASHPLITRYRLLFSILLALEQCSMLMLSVNPILMHSLSLLLQSLIPYPQS